MTDFLTDHWLTLALLSAAAVLGFVLVIRWQRRRAVARALAHTAATFALLAVGGLIAAWVTAGRELHHPAAWAWWVAGSAFAVLVAMLVTVLLTGRWWAPLGYAMGGLLLLGLGGLLDQLVNARLTAFAGVLARVEVVQPAWLVLFALVPVIVWVSFRSLAGLGPVRRWVAIGLRSLLIVLLTLALADVRLRQEHDRVTTLFLIDRSLSVPEKWEANPNPPPPRLDRRWERIKRFINQSVEHRGRGHQRDRVGVIVFGRRPRLELPPAVVPRLNFNEVVSPIDGNYTDIAAALKLGLASFPEGTAKRIVLLSDGNQNLGNAEEQAQMARRNGVQIDVVPLAAGQRNTYEVMIQSVEAPPQADANSQVPIRVLIRSYSPHTVVGELTLQQVSEGRVVNVQPPTLVRVGPGLTPIVFRRQQQQKSSFTYEARFEPKWVEDKGVKLPAESEALVRNDRVQNNRATTHVIARNKKPRILVIEPERGDHEFFIDRLARVGGGKFEVRDITAQDLPQNRAELAILLSNNDCVILANVAASDVAEGVVEDPEKRAMAAITEQQQEIIRSNTHDQGSGLIMIGGPNGFGAGGWHNTPIEKALPVDCDIKSIEVTGKGGLVLIMHASEMAEGNRWQKEIAKLAIRRLSPLDMLGLLYWDWSGQGQGHTWHIPFQTVGTGRQRMLRLVDQMSPGDMPSVDPALEKAYAALTDPKNGVTVKHIIFISDGDHWDADKRLLAKLKAARVTCTTVCITTHGVTEERKMADIAGRTGGRFYNVKSPNALPAIYIKETRIVSQSFIYAKRFQPQLVPFTSGPTASVGGPLPPLYGYVRTTPKTQGFVEVPILAPRTGDMNYPILAYWHYGLGKSVAFTSDARSGENKQAWDREWASSDMYSKFWDQVVDWSLRAVETGELAMSSEYNDGKVRVVVEARDVKNPNAPPMSGLPLKGSVTTPSGRAEDTPDLKFEETSPGVYEASFRADVAGSYFIRAQAAVKDKGQDKLLGVRSGVTIPYSPEFAEMESNAPLLEKLRTITGGQSYADGDEALDAAAASGEVFRLTGLPPSRSLQPIWYWLLVMAAVVLFFDVAVRRIAVNPSEVAAAAERWWGKLRGRAQVAEAAPQFLDRLKSRKAQIAETIDRARSAQRFDAGEAPVAPPPEAGAPQPPRPPAQAAPPPSVAPQAEQEAADAMGRLMKAKKRVWEEREKDKDK
jgi:uncharacterized membrane protein